MFEVKNLTFGYEIDQVLNNISLRVNPGKLCALLGPNGCGKTTLLRCCMNLVSYSEGEISLGGVNLKGLSAPKTSRLVAYVQQEHTLTFPFIVKDIVLMGRNPHLTSPLSIEPEHREKVEEALELVGIKDLAKRPYTHISGGQRQLVLLARAWAQDTPLILLDEPTSSLDINNQLRIWDLLQKMASEGKILLVSTHQPEQVLWFCHQVVVMNSNGIVADGSPREVFDQAILDSIYHSSCQLLEFNGTGIILPKSLGATRGSEDINLGG